MRIRKILAVAGVAITATAMSAPQTFNISFGGDANSNASSAESDTIKSIGRGVGVNETEALKDAYRDAIERAIGLYVDAETVAKNDEIVKDQILTQSNAYITHYDKIKTTNISGGLIEVRIVATVKKRALTTKVSEAMPGGNFSLGSKMQDLHANIATSEKRNADAAALLRNALKDISPIQQLMKPKICVETQKTLSSKEYEELGHRKGRHRENKSNGDTVGVRYMFKVELDREKYFKEVVPKLKPILEQISLEPPREFRMSSMNLSSGSQYFYDREKFMRGSIDSDLFSYAPISAMKGALSGTMFAYLPSVGNTSLSFDDYDCDLSFSIEPSAIRDYDRHDYNISLFTLITELNDRSLCGKAVQYILDKESTKVMNEWFVNRGCKENYRRNDNPSIIYNVAFLGADGEEINVTQWKVNNISLMNFGSGSKDGLEKRHLWKSPKTTEVKGDEDVGVFYATPFVGCAGGSYLEWLDFDFHKDDLSKIKQVRIQIAE